MSDVQLPEITADEKQWAMFAHIGSCMGFWVPLIIMLMKGDSAYVKYHATQAIVISLIVGVAAVPIALLTFGLCTPIIFVAWIFQIMQGMKANKGTWDGYPALASIGRPPEAPALG
jgi:uncharacterized membrane protein